MRDDAFEWDDRKAAANVREHRVTFAQARLVFDDFEAIDRDDPDPDEVEDLAYRKVGQSASGRSIHGAGGP